MIRTSAIALLLTAAAVPVGEFKKNEIEGLGKELAGYLEARRENKSLDKVQEAVAKELGKIEKRIKRDPLSLPGDLGLALWDAGRDGRKGSLNKGKVGTELVEAGAYWDEKTKFSYAFWVPKTYDASKPHPLVLCIPDEGEKPTDHLTERWNDAALRDAAILVAVSMPEDKAVWMEGITGTKETGVGNVAYTWAEVLKRFAVDSDRVFLAGHGRGVELGANYASTFPDRFAGFIGRKGDVGDVLVENLLNVPSFFAGAGGRTTELAEKVKALGRDNMTLMPEGKDSDAWSWMQGRTRAANPAEVHLKLGVPVPNRAYWLEVRPTDQTSAWLRGKVSRAENTITVEGEGISRFSIHFNDALVDLDKPVKIVCNGTLKETTVPRSLPRALDLIANTRSDPGRIFVASVEFDLPPKPKEPKDPKEQDG